MTGKRGILSLILLSACLSLYSQEPEGGLDVSNPIELDASLVTASPPSVKVAGDTLVFSAGAYRLEDDAMLEDLLKKLPGLEFNGGTITLYGRRINKLLVNGKIYFGGDLATGLKSISADAVESVAAYERESDEARISGVDDGEEEPVLDVKIKKSAMGRTRGFAGGGYGTVGRYKGNASFSRIERLRQWAVNGNLLNTPAEASITNAAGSQLGSGSDGDRARRNFGMDFSSSGDTLVINSHLKYNGADRFLQRNTRSENIHAGGANFSESGAASTGSNDKVSGELQLEWKPRRDLTLLVKPSFDYSAGNSWSAPVSRTYGSDPSLDEAAVLLNTVTQSTLSNQERVSAGLNLSLTRRFQERGRSATIRLQGGLYGNSELVFNDYNASYRKRDDEIRKQYINTPSSHRELLAGASWNEPLGGNFHLQLTLNGKIIHNTLQRNFYSFEDKAGDWTVRDPLPDGYQAGLNPLFTSGGSYTGKILTGTANVKYSRRKFNASAGVTVRPYWTDVIYTTDSEADGSRSGFVCYVTPTFNLKYNRSKNQFVSLSYRSWTNAPNPERLLPVRSGTNPMNIRTGNPGLKPSLIRRLTLTYNYSDSRKGRSLVCNAGLRSVKNETANLVLYDPETGGRESVAENIDGNWSADGSVVAHLDFRGTPLSLVNTAVVQYNNEVSYLYNNLSKASDINTMRRLMLKDRLELKGGWNQFEMTARLGAEYTDERSLLRAELNQQPYVFYGGLEGGLSLPGRWRISTDVSCLVQRGYAYQELNTELLLWNASVSKTVLKGKGTLRLSANDILGQQVNMTRRFTANSRQISTCNGVGRYLLLHFIYRFQRKNN